MSDQEFWSLIQASRHAADATGQGDRLLHGQIGTLRDALDELSDSDLLGFLRRLAEKTRRAYTWELWGAGYLAFGSLSDDGFVDMRSWLIAHGRASYEAALVEPDHLADLRWDDELEDLGVAEQWAGLPEQIWSERHPDIEIPETGYLEAAYPDADPSGVPFDENDVAGLRARYPRITALLV